MAKLNFVSKVIAKNAEKAKVLQEKFKGENLLYAGDPTLHWGVGGYPRGRSTLFYGIRGSGKSTLALKGAAAEQQLTGGYVVVFDSERYYQDPNEVDNEGNLTKAALKARDRYTKLGLDPDKLIIISSTEIDILFADLKALREDLESNPGAYSAIVVDSWGGIISEQAKDKIDDGRMADAGKSYGGNAKTIGPALQYLLEMCANSGVTQFYVQHCMANQEQYGPKYLLLGGQKLQFLVNAIVFLESSMAKDSHLLEGDLQSKSHEDARNSIRVGKKIMFKVEKSREVVEGRQGEFFFNFDSMEFALPEQSLFNLAVKLDIIEQSGAWFAYPKNSKNQVKCQGMGKFTLAMSERKELYQSILNDCMSSNKRDATGGFEFGDVDKGEKDD